MSEVNDQTLLAYRQGVDRYFATTAAEVSEPARRWLASSLAGLSQKAVIFEVGTGTGRDAAYLKTLGYAVRCTDAAPEIVRRLRQRGFADAACFNVVTDELAGPFDLIIGNAVLHHLMRDELPPVLAKIRGGLSHIGRAALRLKQGEGEGWERGKLDSDVYVCRWTRPAIEELLAEAGFAQSDVQETTGRSGTAWLDIVAFGTKSSVAYN